jgi:hypothetical protein
MDLPETEWIELTAQWPDAKKFEEGGFTYVFLPNLILPDGCKPASIDALLCPMDRDGYNSRLFLASEIAPVKVVTKADLNWNAKSIRILERNWFAISWRTVPGLRLSQMIAMHLTALR